MEVVRAAEAGACYGVQRALDIARNEAAKSDDVKSLGPLIHNPQVVEQLQEAGVRVLHDVGPGVTGTVVIRSHGVPPQVKRDLLLSNVRIADATCPYVYRAQHAAASLAQDQHYVIVVGDPAHPEVEAICAYAREAGGEVQVIDGVASIPPVLPPSVGVVVQTTQKRRVLDEVLEALHRRGVATTVKDTICSSTAKRQKAAADLAGRVDAMVVIGGYNSSNTTRLYEICKPLCPKTYHIEVADELDASLFEGCGLIGVTAGASTPESQIAPVVEYLERL